MSKFKLNDFQIHPESAKSTEIKITPLDNGGRPVVEDFSIHSIKKEGDGDYQFVKSKYGPLAATDPERVERRQRDRRFSLNPLLRDPLSVEQEERRVIEEKVRVRVDTLADEVRAEAAAAGYQEGLEKGRQETLDKLRKDAAVSLEKFNQLVNEAENAKKEIFLANERFLVELIYRIGKMVLLKELTTDKEYLQRLAKELVYRLGARDNIKIKINPEDANTIDQLKDGLEKTYGQLNNLNIEISSQVERGGCKIETEWNAIDASVDTQLQEIYKALTAKSSGGES